jgi:hypothetical protein
MPASLKLDSAINTGESKHFLHFFKSWRKFSRVWRPSKVSGELFQMPPGRSMAENRTPKFRPIQLPRLLTPKVSVA